MAINPDVATNNHIKLDFERKREKTRKEKKKKKWEDQERFKGGFGVGVFILGGLGVGGGPKQVYINQHLHIFTSIKIATMLLW